jgi:hypothetical protein
MPSLLGPASDRNEVLSYIGARGMGEGYRAKVPDPGKREKTLLLEIKQ